MKKYTKECNEKTIEELEKSIRTIRTEISKLEVEMGVSQQKNTNLVQNKKKQLAVLLTVHRQKKV